MSLVPLNNVAEALVKNGFEERPNSAGLRTANLEHIQADHGPPPPRLQRSGPRTHHHRHRHQVQHQRKEYEKQSHHRRQWSFWAAPARA